MHLTKLLMIGALAATHGAEAGETDWQELLPGVTARVISADTIDAGGRMLVGLELDLPAGYKTYWRVPGETGLPPQFDLSGSHGIAGHRPVWPMPQIDQTAGYLDFVYTGRFVLPIELSLADAKGGDLALDVFLGICSDICVPARARFDLALEADADRANGLRLRQAVATAPVAGSGLVETVRVDGARNELVLTLADDAPRPESLIVACADGDAIFGVARDIPSGGGEVRIPLMGRPNVSGTHTLEILYATPQGPLFERVDVRLN
jgi:DsbC/DsbD-like thiol-disulfide interchange protein